MKNSNVLLYASLLSVLTACGGGSSSGSSEPVNSTGVFLDSPVINIGYRTETLEGATNSKGEFEYLAGETVTFFIGDLEFPAVAAENTVTPLDIAATEDINDPKVVNMIRLLQTLDKDANPINGITITESAKSSATQVNFSQTVMQFGSSAAVTSLIANAGLDTDVTELIDADDAIEHFDSQLPFKFTQSFLADKKFSITSGDSELESIDLASGGTGIMKFKPTEDNGFETDDTKNITWLINSAGALTFREGSDYDDGAANNDYWDWTLAPTAVNGNTISISISVNGFSDGEVESDSFTGTMAASSSLNTISLIGTWRVTESNDVCDAVTVQYSDITFTHDGNSYTQLQHFLNEMNIGTPCTSVEVNDPDESNTFQATVSISEAELKTALNDSDIQTVQFDSANKITIEMQNLADANTVEVTQTWTRQ